METRGKKESPTENPQDFYQKRGAKTGNFVVKTPNIVRKAR
jgi:hypothetical protein